MQIQEIGHIHVLIAECIVWSIVGGFTGRVIIDFDALHLCMFEQMDRETKT